MSEQIELTLENLEEWYMEKMEDRFFKEHAMLEKILSKASQDVARARISIEGWITKDRLKQKNEAGEKIQPKVIKMIQRFAQTILKVIDDIKVPTIHNKITYKNCKDFTSQVNSLYTKYNQLGRKTIPRFMAFYELEVKEIQLNLDSLGKYTKKVNKVLRKKMKGAKEAEELINNVPKINNQIEHLGEIRHKLDEMKEKDENLKKELKDTEDEYHTLMQDPQLNKYDTLGTENIKLKSDLRNELYFSKAIKKMVALMKKDVKMKNLSLFDLEPYKKNIVSEIINEGAKLPKLQKVLIKIRIILEDQNNPLQLNADKIERIVQNINFIVSENGLESQIQHVIDNEGERNLLQKELAKKGLDSKVNNLKDKIATKTLDLEHFSNDIKNKQKEYDNSLQKIAEARRTFEKQIKKETGEEVKVKIKISF